MNCSRNETASCTIKPGFSLTYLYFAVAGKNIGTKNYNLLFFYAVTKRSKRSKKCLANGEVEQIFQEAHENKFLKNYIFFKIFFRRTKFPDDVDSIKKLFDPDRYDKEIRPCENGQ